MPRGPRLDAPGTLHHVMVRGIEKRNIVKSDIDREDFVNRLGSIAQKTETKIFAWALMPNHAHLLLHSGMAGLATYMRRFLTGYAVSYNLRHKRHGHLFQNRYKSIICEEDAYFKELVRYIHLNPLRGGLVKSIAELDRYPWCGHSVLMNRYNYEWQDRNYVLKWFGNKEKVAQSAYGTFVKKGIAQGKKSELTGGGLIRSMGGWSVVKAMRKEGLQEESDARILGSGEFVSHVIEQTEKKIRFQLPAIELKGTVKHVVESHCREAHVPISLLQSGSRRAPLPKLRKKIALQLIGEYGLSLAETARQIGISTSGVAQILNRSKID